MNLQQILCSSGMAQVASNLPIRAARLREFGVSIDEADLLTSTERFNLQRVQCQLSSKSLSTAGELDEHNRLVVLLHRETGESQSWLQSLPLQRLRKMMDNVESRW